jgi:hypothetical protein
VSPARILPVVLLVAWIATFGAAALGGSPLAFDDHPGQLYRAWLVAERGFTPWTWNDGWWAGYPELQFYPPGFAYAAAALHHVSFGALGIDAAYHLLVWFAYAAPGLTSFALLARALGSSWAALPGAFVVLTLSAGLASGVEGGVHIGMVAARLAWAALPLALWLLARDPEPLARATPAAAAVVAAMTLTHPAHVPAALLAVALAAAADPDRRRAVRRALAIAGCAAALTSFWTAPLIGRIGETRALAWGDVGTLVASLARQPLVVVCVVLAIAAGRGARSSAERLVARLPWPLVGLVAIQALILDPRGIAWLPADRLVDSAVLAIVLAASVTAGHVVRRMSAGAPVAAGAMIVIAIALSLPGEALTLWPKPGAWPTLAATERGLRLPDLWTRLRAAPPGRVLFTRSGLPLVYGTEWWRPHTHVMALTPRVSARAIVHGTFTHPSPIAAVVYRGDAGPAPIRALAETRDGRALFGRDLSRLDAATFDRYAERLGVSAVVALEDDAGTLAFVEDNPRFRRAPAPPPFRLYTSDPIVLPAPDGVGRWTFRAPAERGPWITTRMAYYPLWSAWDGDTRLETRRGELGDLEVRRGPEDRPITLRYAPGVLERAGVLISALGAGAWLALLALARRRPQSAAV